MSRSTKSQSKSTAVAPAPTASPELVVKAPLLPSVNAAAVVSVFAPEFGADRQDITALRGALLDDMEEVCGGNMKRAEGMLIGQAHALQSIFTHFARQAANQEHLPRLEAFLRMALKAQNQCRMTLETLGALKNPPVVFARQANINNGGQQQVNNGVVAAPASLTHTANDQSEQSKLLETPDGERLDFGAARAAASGDSAMAAVGSVDGASHRRGKGQGRQEPRQGTGAGKAARARKSTSRAA